MRIKHDNLSWIVGHLSGVRFDECGSEHMLHCVAIVGLKATESVFAPSGVELVVDNHFEFHHSSSHDDCTFNARLVSTTRKDQFADGSDNLSV